MQHAPVKWEQESRARDLERVLDWALVQDSVMVSDWALEPVLAMGLAKVSLVPELAIASALALVKELVQTSETPLVMALATTRGNH